MPVQLHPMFDGHDPRWKKGKRLMKSLFDIPYQQTMSDEQFHSCQNFVTGTIDGCDYNTENFASEIALLTLIRKSYTGTRELGLNIPWHILKAKFDKDRHWPVFEERDGKCYVAFFFSGMRKTDWVEFTQDVVLSMVVN